ncbi:MAG: citryl-CoA lyase [Candidatus Eisenbacteria bacterium]|uniref:citrate synthase (unknown stereospecificity) n=1 Tax=Eiseniibacteriota bacterium TaxID=2212470 RepID=A0A948WBM1_UNCEI|nr:citryl-CoA lyase [Candidatus Eisenbacteria bacterium]MBU1950432.1 citryl-CoA lyase [Candidatus Eisenbacteria bacterium]MBU2690098.1 citryl-CoA lyase [Candidatus Eisenbacteria bacterium]
MASETWKTAITKVEPNKLLLRGYRIDELMGRVSFAEAIFLAVSGELPTPAQAKLVNAIFVSSIDHGATPPSALGALNAASTRATLGACVAAGVLPITQVHGGAGETAMRMFYDAGKRVEAGATPLEAAAAILAEMKAKGQRAAGFGHRIHTEDPRAVRLLQLARESKVEGRYLAIGAAFEAQLEQSLGKKLPLNVDGAIGVVLCELGVDPALGNAFFIISRVPGLVAHIVEEMSRERPMRHIDIKNHEYDGPAERPVKN